MKKELQNKDKGLGFLRHWKVMTMTLLLLTFSIGQMWAEDYVWNISKHSTWTYSSTNKTVSLNSVQSLAPDAEESTSPIVLTYQGNSNSDKIQSSSHKFTIGTDEVTLTNQLWLNGATSSNRVLSITGLSGKGTMTLLGTTGSNRSVGMGIASGNMGNADHYTYGKFLDAAKTEVTSINITTALTSTTTYYINVSGSYALYALIWTPENTDGPFAVTYDKNNDGASGTMTDANSPYEKDATVTVLGNSFTAPTGMSFTGWNTKADGSGTSYAAGNTFDAVKDVTLYAQWAYPATGTGTITYALTYDKNEVTPSVSGVSTLSSSSTAFTLSSLTIGVNSDKKAGYSAKIENATADESRNVALQFTVADGYTFTPSDVSMTIFANSTSNMKAKVVLSDGVTTVQSEELSCASSADSDIEFASGAFTGKKFEGNVSVTVYLWLTSGSGKRAYIKSPITITGTVAAACTKPDAPTALSCTAQTANTLTFGWTKETNAVGYVAKLYSDSGCETEVDSKDLGDVNTVTFTGLSNSTTYYCKVQSKGNGTTYCEDGNVTAAASGATDAPSCGAVTAPTQLLVTATTAEGASFTIVDDEDAFNYELYIIDSNTAPTGSSTATHTSTEKTKDVTGLTSGTTYYAWVRSVCDADHKSTWTASSSFKVRTDPALVIYPVKYVIGSGNLDMSSRYESANTDSPVLWEMKEDYAGASVTGAGLFTATVAGEYTIVANQAGNATYVAGHAEQTVEVLEAEISDIYIWSKASKYGGDDKCISATDANKDANANAASTTLNYSTLAMDGMTSMGRPGGDAVVTLTFSVKGDYSSLFGIKSICTMGKLEEAAGGQISWDNGSTWTALDAYGSGDGEVKTFNAPTGVFPASFKIKFVSASTSVGGLYWRNALVTLEAKKTVTGVTEALVGAEVNGSAISSSDLATLLEDKTVAISTAYAAAPTVTFKKQVTTSYAGGWPADVEDVDVEVTASDITTAWRASQTIGGQAYTITLAKPTEPSLETTATSFTLTSTKNATDTKSFTFSGMNLTSGNVTIALESSVAGMTVTPAEVTPTAGVITDQEVTITYKSLENVAEANVNLIVSYSETVKLTIPLTYSSTRGWDTPNNVTGSITWDFSKAASSDVTISNSEVTVLANYDVENDPTKIVTDNLAGKGEKFSNSWLRTFYLQFNTTVNGRLAMEYSDTGSSSGRRTRYMYVNGVRYGTGSNTSASHTLQDPVYVTAGTITLTAKIDTEGKEEAQWNDANVQLYQMVFVQTHDITFVDGGSIPAIHAANGETVSLPDVDAGDVPAGMSFNGWFIGDTKIGNAGDDYTMGDEDVALTAKFRTACTTPTIAWDVQPTNSRSITGTQDVSVTLTGYTGAITWTSSTPAVATISGTDENATITYVGEGSTTITAQFIIPEGQSLCDGTYKVTKEITLMDCPEPAALTNEIARFQVPACGIDHEHALTNEDVARDNCTVTVTNGVGGSSSNWSQISEGLWYAKFQSAGAVTMNVTGGFQEGDLIYVYLRAYNGQGLKLNKSEVEIKTTQNDGAEVALEYELLAADIETDGSIILKRVSSNTFVNRVIVVRPPCRATNVAWATEPAKAHVGDADGTATITTNYVTGVTYSSSNTDVATIASGNGTNTVTIHYVAAGTTTITATVTGEDPFCTDPVSVSKEIRVIGDAPAYGTLYKFEVKEMADAYIFSENNASMEMTTDNYLSLLQSGELMASVSGGYNRLYISNNAFVFANSAGGQLTMSLDYPLAVGDVIKYKNVNGNNDRANLNEPRDAGRTTVLSGNGGTAIQTFDVPAAWAGATELTLTRNNNNPKIAYFEVYRRPVATGVSLTNMTIRQGVSTTPVMTLAPTTDAIVNSQTWEIVGTPTNLTGAGINATTGAITTGTLDDETQNGSMTVRVTINGTLSATCTVTVIKSYVRANVSGSMLWDWTASCWDGQPNVELTGDEKDTDILMANTGTSMVCSDDFRSDMLVINGNYAWRLENTNKYFQGTKITIYPSVAGLMRVNFRAPSSGQTCTVKINGVTAGAHGNSFGWSDYVEVPANTTDGIAIEMTNSTNGYTRVNKIEFLALENRRTAGWIKPGELGTVCLENTSIVEGATIYELQGPDQYGKLVFDEVQSGEVVAGTPYLFEATATGQISFYKKVNAAHAGEAGELNGMHGTFSGETFSPSDGNAANLYYFSGNAIWCVANRSTDANIPAHGCYLNMEEFRELPIPSPTPAPGRRRITLGVNGKNTPTGIENGELINGENGVQKVLINGELFILRGEKMYDATGRLVK